MILCKIYQYTLHIALAPPQVDQGIVKKEINVGEHIMFTCTGGGYGSDYEISWLIDERPVNSVELPPTIKVELSVLRMPPV